jgi:uncharacterized protein (UPF0332 family)
MNKLKWCIKVKNGLELIEPNENLCNAYFKKAENALAAAATLKENKEWEISSRYYAMYFALYALLMKIGIKCENHSCTIEFMKQCLSQFFGKDDIFLLQNAMKARVDVQYYTDRVIDEKQYKEIRERSSMFLVLCKETYKKLNNETTTEIRAKIEEQQMK